MPSSNSKAARQLAALLGAPRRKPASTRGVSGDASRPSARQAASKPTRPLAATPPVLATSEHQAEPAESETACPDLLASEKRKCAASKKDGTPCRAKPLPDGDYCVFHAPAYAERFQEGRVQGARRKETFQLPLYVDEDLWNVDFSLDTRPGLQGSMEAVMRLLILGRIPTRHASILMRFFDAAIRNLHGVDTLKTIDYVDTLQDFMRTSGLIERDLDDQALRERVQRIGDAGATRQEILKANEAFGYTPPQPKQQPSRKAMESWDHDQPHRKRESLITAFWGPGTGEGGKLTMQDLFPNGIPEHQRRE